MSLSHYDAPNGSYTSKIPPGTTALRNYIKKKFGITRTEVIRDKSRCAAHGSEHCECGAIDAFTTTTVLGRAIFDWLVKISEAAGVQSVIFQHRQVGFGNPKERHRAKADHMDHVHVGLSRWARANLTTAMLERMDEEEDMTPDQAKKLEKVYKALYTQEVKPRDRITELDKQVKRIIKKLDA